MPNVPHIVLNRQRRRQVGRRSPARRASLVSSSFLSLAVVGAVLTITLFYTSLIAGLPSLETLPALLNPPQGTLLTPTRLYDRTGIHLIVELENTATAGRQYLYYPYRIEGIPSASDASPSGPYLPVSIIAATVSASDPGFWNHAGYTFQGIREDTHPTLAQRLVAELVLWEEPPSISRSLRERLLAAQITAHFGRQQVLEWYLNSAQYGSLVYGIDSAARMYLNKPAQSLSVAEAALLAAVAEAPSLNPLAAPQIAMERQQKLIDRMLDQGVIDKNQASHARQETLTLVKEILGPNDPAPAFTNLVIEQLSEHYNRQRIERGGLDIITTLDYDLQFQSLCAVGIQIARLTGQQSTVDSEAGCHAARLLATLPIFGKGLDSGLTANTVVVDPSTGQILAMVGDLAPGMDPSREPGPPPGSLFTPFIYLTGFTRGLSPGSLTWDIPSSLPENLRSSYTPQDRLFGPVRIRTAFNNDYLVPAVQVLSQVGAENVYRIVQQLGVKSIEQADIDGFLTRLPLLSGGDVTLLEMVRAYGVFANQGVLAGHASNIPATPDQPIALASATILKVTDQRGQTWLDCQEQMLHCSPQSRPVLSQQLAYMINHVLSDETSRWQSLGHPNPLEIGRTAAAKIGLVSEKTQAWTVGYTPQLAAGVWIGSVERDPNIPLPTASETRAYANGAAALWHAIIQYASRDLVPSGWTPPAGISQIEVCDPSGLLPTSICPTVVKEIYLPGTEPTHTDNLYRVFQINRETGRMATVFTPPSLVEEKVYMVVPAEAVEWANLAGLPVPPDSYDVILAPPSASQHVRLDTPAMFAYVSGMVTIRGTAAGPDFAYYRIQVGKGLNPRVWILVGEASSVPVGEGVLGQWDTNGLSGLYAIQLQVINKEQRLETAIIQVTVDSQPPQVEIISLQEGQAVKPPNTGVVVLSAAVSDDVGVGGVEFYIDDRLLVTVTEPPYTIAWQAQIGSHTLRVKALDLAKNSSEKVVQFSIEK